MKSVARKGYQSKPRQQRRSRPVGSLADQAYEFIRSAIVSGRFEPGTALSRRRLAAELGMSFLPVSEAFQRLMRDGLIESRPRVGTRIRVASAEELTDHSGLRQALESHTARLFAASASAQQRAALRKKAKEFDRELRQWKKAPGSPVPTHLLNLHFEFHLDVARAAGVESIQALLERERLHLFQTLQHDLETAAHSRLAEVLVAASPQEAASHMLQHVAAEAPTSADSSAEPPRWRTSPARTRTRSAPRSK